MEFKFKKKKFNNILLIWIELWKNLSWCIMVMGLFNKKKKKKKGMGLGLIIES